MKRQTIKLVSSEKQLPPVKTKTTLTDRNIFAKSPVNDPFPAIRINDKPSPELLLPRSNLNLHKKLTNLINIIKDQDQKIRAIEAELSASSSSLLFKSLRSPKNFLDLSSELNSFIETESKQSYLELEEDEKNLKELYKETLQINKFKDIEILKLKKYVDEENQKIHILSAESVEYKNKIAEYESQKAKIVTFEKQINLMKTDKEYEIDIISKEAGERTSEIENRMQDIQELVELVQRSEEKRAYNNEYNIFMESNEQRLKEKIHRLESEKEKIKTQLNECKEKIKKQGAVLTNLTDNLISLKLEIEEEKKKGALLSCSYESAQEALKESQSRNYELESSSHRQNIGVIYPGSRDDFMGYRLENEEIGDILIDKSEALENFKEKMSRLQRRYEKMEKELIKSRRNLERLKKNEIMLRNQFSTKDFMINQMEKLLTKVEKSIKEYSEDSKEEKVFEKLKQKIMPDLRNCIQNIKKSYLKLDGVKCIKCLKMISDGIFLVPCGHLTCVTCWVKDERKCKLCSSEVLYVIKSKLLNKIFSRIALDSHLIKKANKQLKQL